MTLKKRLKEFAIILLVTVCLLAIMEIAVRIFAPQEDLTLYENDVPIATYDSLTEYTLNPGSITRHKFREFDITYHITPDGFRQEKPVDTVKRKPRLLFIGDSFTFGMGNELDKTWVSRLSALLKDSFEVINAGVPGYALIHEMHAARKFIPKFKPDIVILLSTPADLSQFHEVDSAKFPRQEGELKSRNNIWSAKSGVSLHIVPYLKGRLMHWDPFYLSALKMENYPHVADLTDRNLTTASGYIRGINEVCKANNAKFILLGCPGKGMVIHQAHTEGESPVDNYKMDKFYGELASDNAFVYLAPFQAMVNDYKEKKEDHFYRIDGHPNNYGNEFLAQFITENYFLAGRNK